MPSVAETTSAPLEMAAGLQAGTNTLSLNQTITFTQYIKLVLPLDGFVYWVKADLLSQAAILNAFGGNQVAANQSRHILVPAKAITAQGSIHYSTELKQEEDRTATVNYMIFTAEQPINDLNSISPDVLYIAEFQGEKFAFSRRDRFYQQAGLYHYRGDALYSVMDGQIIDSMAGFDVTDVIVSNSLPIWLTLNKFMPMYPSFLVDQNLAP